MIEAALRHDRALVLGALASVVLASWLYLLGGAGMSMGEMGGMLMPLRAEPWTVGDALIVLAMWGAMMAAMMLPSAAPMLLLFAALTRRGVGGSGTVPRTAAFGLGYVAVWGLFSLAAAALQFALERLAILSPMMATTSVAVASAVLIGAGLYQWTPLKRACLRGCRSPLDFLTARWRPGAGGAFRMGLDHGAFCVGCCWVLMLLLFVGGVMNMLWIGALAAFVMIEKMAPAGEWVSRAAGLALIAWGVATTLSLA